MECNTAADVVDSTQKKEEFRDGMKKLGLKRREGMNVLWQLLLLDLVRLVKKMMTTRMWNSKNLFMIWTRRTKILMLTQKTVECGF